MNETESVCGSVQLSIDITDHKWQGFDTPLWLAPYVHVCVCQKHESMCSVLTHVEVVCMLSFFSHRVQLLGNCLYALEFPSADGNGSVQPPHPTSPLSSRITTLLFLAPASQLLSLTCIWLTPQILLSPVDALCSRCCTYVCTSKCKWGK